jgi:Domain of unknown function (DUF4167)
MIKRQRGRGRNPGQKPQSNNPNRAYESNGPDLKVRGSAQTVFEKYQQLGRDSQSNGDRVLGENYMQHAEHYFRVLRAMQPTFVPRTELMIAGYEDEYEDGDENGGSNGAPDAENGEGQAEVSQPEFQQNRPPRDNRDRDNRDNRDNRDRDGRDRPQRDFQPNREPREPRDPNEPRAESDEDRFGRRRRRRPDRFGNEGGNPNAAQGDNGQGEGQAPRSDNRFEGRREPRQDYRGEGAPLAHVPAEAPASFNQPVSSEPVGFSDPQEIVVSPDGAAAAPARERRPRPPRAPRPPRDAAPVAETGFGDEMPAFLAVSVPVVSGE